MQSGRVISVDFISHISEGLDYCSITIDFDECKIFGSYSDLVRYLNETVLYEVAKDMFHGEQIMRVVNIYEQRVVQTVERAETAKLIPASSITRSVCSFSVDSLKLGDYEYGCVALLCGFTKGASDKTTWADLNMIDRDARAFTLRIFTNKPEGGVDPEVVLEDLTGHYVRFDAKKTKYGLQTTAIELVNVPVLAPPEVEVAKEQIRKIVSGDSQLVSYMNQFSYLDEIEKVMYGEPGYHLVELASELYMIQTLSDISCEYDIKLLTRAAVTSRGYLLPSKTKFSKSLLNTNKVLRSDLKNDRELLLLLDVLEETGERNINKSAFYRIKKFCRQTIEERRGMLNEEEGIVSMRNVLRYC